MEKAICGDPAAARADTQMASRYRQLMRVLSPKGRLALRAEQRAFLARLGQGCHGVGTDGRKLSYAQCLAGDLANRSFSFSNALQVAGGHRLLKVSISREKHVAGAEEANLPPSFSLTRTSLQIERPSAAQARWNAAAARWLDKGVADVMHGQDLASVDAPGIVEVAIEVIAASPDLIAARRSTSRYYGGAHGMYHSATMLWSLKLGRPLRADEVFAALRSTELRRIVAAHYKAGGHVGHDGCDTPDPARSKLLVNASGPVFSWDPYETGGYPCGGDSQLTWRMAAPYLRAPLPFERSALAAPVPVLPYPSAAG